MALRRLLAAADTNEPDARLALHGRRQHDRLASSEQVIFTWTAPARRVLPLGGLAGLRRPTATSTSPPATTPTRSRPTASRRSTSGPAASSGTPSAPSANTNDLNGKILRIRRSRRDRRARRSARLHGPDGNLFPGRHGADAARDLRDGLPQPVPDHGRPEDRLGADGRLRPGRRRHRRQPRPAGQRRVQRDHGPGNYGWPYCIRDNVPYNDYDFATGVSGPKFNCAAPVNDSPNNTGLTNLPPAKPATMWMGYTETDPRFPGLGTGGAPIGGPRYHFDPQLATPAKFPEYYDGSGSSASGTTAGSRPRRSTTQGNATGVLRDAVHGHVLPRRWTWSSGPTARST